MRRRRKEIKKGGGSKDDDHLHAPVSAREKDWWGGGTNTHEGKKRKGSIKWAPWECVRIDRSSSATQIINPEQ